MAFGRIAEERGVLRISGAGTAEFLDGLVSANVEKPAQDGGAYAALLTPQGKYLADFLLHVSADEALIDVAMEQVKPLAQRLAMYRLRRKLEIAASGLTALQIWGEGAEEAAAKAAGADGVVIADPRDPALGFRVFAADGPAALAASGAQAAARADWDALRVAHMIPEAGTELGPDSYILEYGFERLHGVDFRKGCYVGQEIVARMKHKTELRKGLVQVEIDGEAPAPGTEIVNEGGKPAGVLGTVSGGVALAHLRFDRAGGEMKAGGATVRRPAG
ncbi:YgfZ/GcvT domain-containing protein [Rhodovulum sp. DZ06]|uniref:CAF17-like 4Fe-4S cluster assembly/insertion protein YgfZ n=1 Tax=Rhodovulum sp. DZ06 TaxID=3425126 RepID=UPI003D355B78